MSFEYDKKDAYTQDEIDKLLEQHANFVVKSKTDELKEKIVAEKNNEVDKEISTKEFIGSIPQENRDYASKLLDKGLGIDDLKEMKDLFEAKKQVIDVEAILGEAKQREAEQAEQQRKTTLKEKAATGSLTDAEYNEYLLTLKQK